MNLIIDIETIGDDFEELASSQQEFLLRFAEKELNEEVRKQKIDDAKRYLSLYPFTAKVVSIGLLRTDTEKTLVLFENEEDRQFESEDGYVKYIGLPEKAILERFWEYVIKANKLISFNGLHFDFPFLILRSAMLKIKPSINLLSKNAQRNIHIDLLDELTLHGKLRKFNLDFYCKAFGIISPKEHGITGMDVKELYRANKIDEIAIYCSKDVWATYELFKIWEKYLNFQKS